MATLKIEVVNGEFVATNNCYVSELTPRHVVGNGWDVVMEEAGITATASRRYSNGEHEITCSIREGFLTTVIKTPCGTKTSRKIARESDNFILGFSGGRIDERYAWYRTNEIQAFMDKHHINTIKHANPNGEFHTHTCVDSAEKYHSYVLTDGTPEEISYSSGLTETWREKFPGTCSYEEYSTIVVSGARWTIFDDNGYRVLYTLETDLNKLNLE